MKETLNCIGLACPIPVVKTKKAIEAFTEDGEITVLADNETCVSNLTKLANSMNLGITSEKTGEKEYTVKIDVKLSEVEAAKGKTEEVTYESCEVPAAPARGAVVAVGANVMGTGEEALGKALMKAFLFALSQAEEQPEAVLFYNSGAYLTCEGSDSLEDLKNMAEAGVKIMTCGTCLNFYGLTDKLAVGTVTNMYDIVETQLKAVKIVRP